MHAALLLLLAFSLALYLIPAWLSKRTTYGRINEFVVSAEGASAEVFQNSSVAYAAQMATFGPFFVWGLAGDTLGAVINCAFFLLGLLLLTLAYYSD